jgi:protein-S-isoprenylcysteine O-methyltransferase Ste14
MDSSSRVLRIIEAGIDVTLAEIIEQSLHYGDWPMVLGWFLLFAGFIAFIPFNRKSNRKPNNVYIAFILASALEMFGIPLSMYFITWAFGLQVPQGLLWGHTLEGVIGYWGMYIGFGLNLAGGILIVRGWREIHSRYWAVSKGELVTDGIYSLSRHPQYVGFILMTLGLLVHWATLPLLIMWPILVVQYYKCARREEVEMEEEFGDEYRAYKENVPMFLPSLSMLISKLN